MGLAHVSFIKHSGDALALDVRECKFDPLGNTFVNRFIPDSIRTFERVFLTLVHNYRIEEFLVDEGKVPGIQCNAKLGCDEHIVVFGMVLHFL
jgi:hypothetical protein